MTFNPDLHRRRSIRLRDHDYSSGGYYFVTICTHGRICYFGDIRDSAVSLSPAGETAHRYWEDIPNHFDNVDIDEIVIMSNHIHGIVILIDDGVGAGLKPAPTDKRHGLSEIIPGLKTFSARRIDEIRDTTGSHVWQRNYHEHIIRDDADLDRIRGYVINNPMNWENDEDFIE